MKKRSAAIVIAATLSCLNLGDRTPVGAQPLEIESAIRIPGPPLVIQKPLELSLEQRADAQQIIWEYRFRETLQVHGRSHRNTDAGALHENPLPAVSAFLSDAYRALNQ